MTQKKYTSPFNKLSLPKLEPGPQMLSFSLGNAKLKGLHTALFNLPAGYTCPGACECLSHFDRVEQRVIDGPNTEFRCYAASIEAAFKSVRDSVDRNLAILKGARTTAAMAEVIDLSLPSKYYHRIRIHGDGDYYSAAYFLAWVQVAVENPQRTFYGYTKNLPVWIKYRECIPENMVLTASRGGKWDRLIEPNKLRSAVVVYHPDEAERLGLEIDHDDSHARDPHGGDFALLIHGTQPAGSDAAEAKKRLDKEDIKYAYSLKK